MLADDFVQFLVKAKKNSYASGTPATLASRPGSHDLHYSEPPFLYIDTWLGGFHFIGQEAVWMNGTNIWGMNYYGKMLTEPIPPEFGPFLKAALSLVPYSAPYRGPVLFSDHGFVYSCEHSGDIEQFNGEESITSRGKVIYSLVFHGGEIRD